MGKRDLQRKLKLCLLKKIKENKNILFGKNSQTLTKEIKAQVWKEIYWYGRSIGVVDDNKEWNYVRDVWWPNVRKSTLEKIYNASKTGIEGAKDEIFNIVDEEVISIRGKDLLTNSGLNVSESVQADILDMLPTSQTLSEEEENGIDPSGTNSFDHSIHQNHLGKSASTVQSTEAERKKLQIELLKIQIYKAKLESKKLEVELGIPSSIFTEDILTDPSTSFEEESNNENKN